MYNPLINVMEHYELTEEAYKILCEDEDPMNVFDDIDFDDYETFSEFPANYDYE